MSTPFGQLIAARSQDPEQCVQKVLALVRKYGGVSSNQRISLDESAWFGAICFLGMNQAAKETATKTTEGNVINVIAGSNSETHSNAS